MDIYLYSLSQRPFFSIFFLKRLKFLFHGCVSKREVILSKYIWYIIIDRNNNTCEHVI